MGLFSGKAWSATRRVAQVVLFVAAAVLAVVSAMLSMAPNDRGQTAVHWPGLALALVAALVATGRLLWPTRAIAFVVAGYLLWVPSSIYTGDAPDLILALGLVPWFLGLLAIRLPSASALWWLLFSAGFYLVYLATARGQDPGVFFTDQRLLGAQLAETAAWLVLGAVALRVAATVGELKANAPSAASPAATTTSAENP